MYSLVDKFKGKAQKSFEKYFAKSSTVNFKQGKYKLNIFYYYSSINVSFNVASNV